MKMHISNDMPLDYCSYWNELYYDFVITLYCQGNKENRISQT